MEDLMELPIYQMPGLGMASCGHCAPEEEIASYGVCEDCWVNAHETAEQKEEEPAEVPCLVMLEEAGLSIGA